MAINLHNNFTRLQEVNSAVIANIFKEDTDVPLHHLTEVTETIQDLSNELSVLVSVYIVVVIYNSYCVSRQKN